MLVTSVADRMISDAVEVPTPDTGVVERTADPVTVVLFGDQDLDK